MVNEYMNGDIIDVNDVDIQMNPMDSDRVEKIMIGSSQGMISFKPKTKHRSNRNGLDVTEISACNIDELPQNLVDMYNLIRREGKAKVKAYYSIWNKQENEDIKTYRFVKDMNQWLKWEILSEQS